MGAVRRRIFVCMSCGTEYNFNWRTCLECGGVLITHIYETEPVENAKGENE